MYTTKVEETWFERTAKKIKLWFVMLFHGFFRGMKEADTAMIGQVNGGDGDAQEIAHRIELDGVYADILKEKKTQEVLELVDMSYRVAREANQYDVTLIGDVGDDSVGSDKELKAVAVKKVAMKYDKHKELFNERGYHIILIQNNKLIPKKGNFSATIKDFVEAINTSGNDFVPLIEINYDGFTPRFTIAKYITKAVARETKAGKTKIDLYLPTEAGQFTKTDAILIAELHRILENDLKKTDFLDILELSFVTDKAFGAEDYIKYMFKALKFNKISIFDGYFVLTFNVSEVSTFDIVEAHKTESLTKKYDNMAPKKDEISVEDLGAIERRRIKLDKKGKEQH